MGWYPDAIKRPITGGTDGKMSAHLGAVLHVNQSTGNLFNWFNGGKHDVSAHFEVYEDGRVEQYIDTTNDSWCQRDGNMTYISIETEGYGQPVDGHPATPLTSAQLTAIAKLYAWLHTEHGIPLTLAEKPGERGFGWHGMGAAAGVDWGHADCPGPARKAQRAQILTLAEKYLPATTPPKPTPPPAPTPAPLPTLTPDGFRFKVYAGPTGPAYAFAPGTFSPVTELMFEAMVHFGECDRVIHRVSAASLAALKRIALG